MIKSDLLNQAIPVLDQKKESQLRTPKTYRKTFSVTKRNPIQIFFAFKYRILVILIILFCTPLIYASNANSPQSIEAIGYEKTFSNGIISKISKKSIGLDGDSIAQITQAIATNKSEFTFTSKIYSSQEVLQNLQGIITGEIEKAKKAPLDTIVPIPANPQLVSFLRYPKYNINVPIQYSKLQDIFQTNDKGEFIKDKNGTFIPYEENVARDGPLGVPIQRLLIDGIVHIAFTPQPGEIGNSYIVGHSSNFSTVQSNYNYILKPIEQISQPGEEFFVYDKDGRELKFRVFDTLKIDERNTSEAYKDFADRRVVTLQTSILSYCTSTVTGKYGYQPCERWLTRGELVL
ncbi:MAG: sortase [candidate division SR1 bacterium]|nr:sortase [candidate division SR1 bacterium]